MTEDIKKADSAYNSPSWWYDIRGFFILTLCYRDTLWHQVGFFSRNIEKHHLEVAVGSGTLLWIVLLWRGLCRRPKAKIVAFDDAERMLEGARQRFAGRPHMTLLRTDAAALEFPDDHFDSANIANAFHCFPEPAACLREIFRVLRPGAALALNVVLYPPEKGFMAGIARYIEDWGMNKGILYKPYREEEAAALITAAGFHIKTRYVRGYTLNIVAEKPRE